MGRILTYLLNLSILLLLTVVHDSYGQHGSIDGKIVDVNNNQGIPYASVSLVDPSSDKIVGGVVSDDLGKFEIAKISKGQYQLIVSYIGYTSE